MRTPVDLRLREEAAEFQLRFTCEHCVHFAAEKRACANEYPTLPHLGIDLNSAVSLEFCKEFELA